MARGGWGGVGVLIIIIRTGKYTSAKKTLLPTPKMVFLDTMPNVRCSYAAQNVAEYLFYISVILESAYTFLEKYYFTLFDTIFVPTVAGYLGICAWNKI